VKFDFLPENKIRPQSENFPGGFSVIASGDKSKNQ
jgi:hypothetical protein